MVSDCNRGGCARYCKDVIFGFSHSPFIESFYRFIIKVWLLARAFRGRDIVVKVLDEGFEFEERRYSSLSAIAKEVTGSKWNGFLFFGLTNMKKL